MIITSKLESEMRLVGRHLKILEKIMEKGPIGIIKLSQIVGIPEHKVRYSLRILEQEKLIEPSPEGARPTKKAKKELKNLKEVLMQVSKDAQAMIEDIEKIEQM